MDIVDPTKSAYLKDAAKKRMSFSREMSLKRAVSHRAVLVRKDGTLADTQYADQYVDRDRVRADLKRAASRVSFGGALGAADDGASAVSRDVLQRSLTKCARTRCAKRGTFAISSVMLQSPVCRLPVAACCSCTTTQSARTSRNFSAIPLPRSIS
jgi:hypothetical protein